MDKDTLTWLGIGLLLIQSGTFSGLNLVMFGVSALRLRTMTAAGNKRTQRLLELRRDSNFLLTTILWGNVATNVLLTMLSEKVMFGVAAFLFSTFAITLGGEIVPQAYFSRNAVRMANLLWPFLRLFQILLYPIAKPSALMLDAWIGKETIDYLTEAEIQEALKRHVLSSATDVGHVEGLGAINFLMLDDLQVTEVGEPIDPASVVQLPQADGRPVFPAFEVYPDDPFLKMVQGSGKRWAIISHDGSPLVALDVSSFLRAALFGSEPADPLRYCHRPVLVMDDRARLGDVIADLKAAPGEGVIERDLIALWGKEKRVITGADLLGYLMRGIAVSAP